VTITAAIPAKTAMFFGAHRITTNHLPLVNNVVRSADRGVDQTHRHADNPFSTRTKVGGLEMNTALLRSTALSIGAAGAMLAAVFLSHGVAAADPGDLWWTTDPDEYTTTSETSGVFGFGFTGSGELDGDTNPFANGDNSYPVLQDVLQADGTQDILGPARAPYDFDTYDITSGDSAIGIPTGSTIEFISNSATDSGVQFVIVPHEELFGLFPQVTETIFTATNEISFAWF
jgi:hypothetical protein